MHKLCRACSGHWHWLPVRCSGNSGACVLLPMHCSPHAETDFCMQESNRFRCTASVAVLEIGQRRFAAFCHIVVAKRRTNFGVASVDNDCQWQPIPRRCSCVPSSGRPVSDTLDKSSAAVNKRTINDNDNGIVVDDDDTAPSSKIPETKSQLILFSISIFR